MRIGIIGFGNIGRAISFSFSKIGHDTFIHDKALNTNIDNVMDTEVCYICVPTNSSEDGSCDVSIVQDVVKDLVSRNYSGIIAIKSTVIIGTTANLIEELGTDKICMVPEFLRERCAIPDFTENHDICVIGTENEEVFTTVKESHGKYPKNVVRCTASEAEACKYFNNLYNATLITFANSFYEVCQKCGISYTAVKTICTNRSHINDSYLDCNENFRGFGGVCLPKDLAAIIDLCKKNNIDVNFFDNIQEENNKYGVSVFPNMRLGNNE